MLGYIHIYIYLISPQSVKTLEYRYWPRSDSSSNQDVLVRPSLMYWMGLADECYWTGLSSTSISWLVNVRKKKKIKYWKCIFASSGQVGRADDLFCGWSLLNMRVFTSDYLSVSLYVWDWEAVSHCLSARAAHSHVRECWGRFCALRSQNERWEGWIADCVVCESSHTRGPNQDASELEGWSTLV